jgi:hypothetical protein
MIKNFKTASTSQARSRTRKVYQVDVEPASEHNITLRKAIKKTSNLGQFFRPSNKAKKAVFKWKMTEKVKKTDNFNSKLELPKSKITRKSQNQDDFDAQNASRIELVKNLSRCLVLNKPVYVTKLENKYQYLRVQLAKTRASMEEIY